MIMCAMGGALSTARVAFGASPQPTVLATLPQPTKVAAYGDRVLWSEFDAPTKRFYLVEKVGALPAQRLPLKPRIIQFDVDAGPGPSGRPMAVYSRCRSDQAVGTPGDPTYLPLWQTSRGCRIYRLDLITGQETRMSGERAAKGSSDYLPTISGHRLAFARITPSSRTPPYDEPPAALLMLNLSNRRLEVLPGGARGIGGKKSGGLYPTGPGPLDLHLVGRRLTYRWAHYRRRDCPGPIPTKGGDPFITEIRVAAAHEPSRVLASACAEQPPSTVVGGIASGKSTIWLETQLFEQTGHNVLIRRGARGKSRVAIPELDPFFATSLALDSTGPVIALYNRNSMTPTAKVVQLAG